MALHRKSFMNNEIKTALSFWKSSAWLWRHVWKKGVLILLSRHKSWSCRGESTCTRLHKQSGEGTWPEAQASPPELLPLHVLLPSTENHSNHGTTSNTTNAKSPSSKGSTISTVQNYGHQKEACERENMGPGTEIRRNFHFSKSPLRQLNVCMQTKGI